MKYNQKAFDKAEIELSRRRAAAERIHQERIAEINVLAPEISTMQSSLATTSLELMKLIVNGDKNMTSLIEQIKEKNIRTQAAISDLLIAVKGDKYYLDVPHTCVNCNDSGYVNGMRCDCFKNLIEKYSVDEINMNCHIMAHDFLEFRLDYYDDTSENGISPREKMSQNYQYCKRYAENFPKMKSSLLFIGKTGLGKTFISSCIAKTLMNNGFNVVFGSTLDFLRSIENEHFGRENGDTLATLINCELLIMDDLGSEFHTSFNESALYAIVNGRLNLDKPTIISTNLSFKELNSTYNERIVSRIACCFDPIQFLGKDIRYVKRQFGY